MPDILRIFCPHAEPRVIERLWEARRYRKLLNYLWVEFLMARGAVRLWGGRPYWLTIDPNNFCQLHCPFCPTGADRGVRGKAMMDLEHFRKLIDRLGPYVIHVDMMNWGESILNKSLPEMIAAAKSHGIEVRLDANFNNVPDGMFDRLIRSGLDVLSLSIDGASAETYGRYRAGGDFDRVLSNVRTLVRRRRELGRSSPWIVWQFLVFRHNEHERPQAAKIARELEVDQVSFVAPSIPNEPGFLWEWMALNPEYQMYPAPAAAPGDEEKRRARLSAQARKMTSMEPYYARRFGATSLLSWAYLQRFLMMAAQEGEWGWLFERLAKILAYSWRTRSGSGAVPYRSAEGDRRSVCKWPWAGMAVNPNGSVSPCCSVEEERDDFGNVFKQGFSSLWNGRLYRDSRRHVKRFVKRRIGVVPESEHVCRRCTAIGVANFKFPNHSPYGSDPNVVLAQPDLEGAGGGGPGIEEGLSSGLALSPAPPSPSRGKR